MKYISNEEIELYILSTYWGKFLNIISISSIVLGRINIKNIIANITNGMNINKTPIILGIFFSIFVIRGSNIYAKNIPHKNGATKYPASFIIQSINKKDIKHIIVLAHIYFQNGIIAAVKMINNIIGLITFFIK